MLGYVGADGKAFPPIWFEGSVINPTYKKVLIHKVFPTLDATYGPNGYIWTQDGAPAHTSMNVQGIWGHIESRACANHHSNTNTNTPRQSVEAVWRDMTADYVKSACQAFRSRLDKCRRGASAAYWNGTVIVCGGLDSSGPPISSFRDCQVLDLTSLPRKWSSGPEMPDLLAYSGHTLIGSRLYVIGGYHTSYPAPGPTQYVYSNKTYVLDMASMTDGWREAEFQLAAPTADLCAVSTDNGRIAMIGALSGSFDPNSIDSWIPLPDQGGSGMGCALGNVTVAGSIFVAVGGGYLRNQVQTLFLPGQDGPSETWQSNIPALQSDRTQMPSGVNNQDFIFLRDFSYHVTQECHIDLSNGNSFVINPEGDAIEVHVKEVGQDFSLGFGQTFLHQVYKHI
eukprot:maker-scaffold212_size255419-snap-gene-1.33 protein:Tk00551 transcript:maker-scaffold212_size255419-snap-gene-1.33-mRNA-1 annotation:"transposase"